MLKILRQLVTGNDNTTYDTARWLGFVAFLIAMGLEIHSIIWDGNRFDIQTFGFGVGALLAGYGAGVKLQGDDTVPPWERRNRQDNNRQDSRQDNKRDQGSRNRRQGETSPEEFNEGEERIDIHKG